jgi:hypothetical protein
MIPEPVGPDSPSTEALAGLLLRTPEKYPEQGAGREASEPCRSCSEASWD